MSDHTSTGPPNDPTPFSGLLKLSLGDAESEVPSATEPITAPLAPPPPPPTHVATPATESFAVAEPAAAPEVAAPQPAAVAQPAAAPQPSAVAPVDDAHTDVMADEVARILSEYEELSTGGDTGGSAEAAAILAEIERVGGATGPVDEALKTHRMDQVVAARRAYRSLLDGDVSTPVSVTPSDLVDIELLQREFEVAEAKARRSMSGPGAFKKFAAARKALGDALAAFGVETYAELQQLAAGGSASDAPMTLQEAADAVAAAEAAWIAVDAAPGEGLASTPEMDALRVRSYRCLGAVVDDTELVDRLNALAASSVDTAPVLHRLSLALRALGLQNVADPVATARSIRDQVRRS